MSTQPATLHHSLISLPDGKNCLATLSVERHDIVLLVDAKKANPNGDPDTGNMPRLQPDTLKGLLPTSLERKSATSKNSTIQCDAPRRAGGRGRWSLIR